MNLKVGLVKDKVFTMKDRTYFREGQGRRDEDDEGSGKDRPGPVENRPRSVKARVHRVSRSLVQVCTGLAKYRTITGDLFCPVKKSTIDSTGLVGFTDLIHTSPDPVRSLTSGRRVPDSTPPHSLGRGIPGVKTV